MKFRKKNLIFLIPIFLISFLCFLFKNEIKTNFEKEKLQVCSKSISEENFTIHFFNVGKADSALIKFENHVILIDAADKNSSCKIKDKLNNLGVKAIDLAIITHPHSDHYGQMEEIVENFTIKRLITAKSRIGKKEIQYKRLLYKLKKKKIKLEFAKAGDNFKIGSTSIQVLGPVKEYKKINNNSLVIKILYKDSSFLFTGDAEKQAEEDIINLFTGDAEKQAEKDIIKLGWDLKSDLIKIGHHGSSTSTSWKFLAAVCPKIAVISAGNRFGLPFTYPSEEILSRLEKAKIKTYVTENLGDIVVHSDGKKIKLNGTIVMHSDGNKIKLNGTDDKFENQKNVA
jgi:competence protein ComEC